MNSKLKIALTQSFVAAGVATATYAVPTLALETQPILPNTLAAKAASISVESCKKKGNSVTTTILNQDGNTLVVIRNEKAGPHTVENSFNKAYTSVSFGRAYNLNSTRAILAGIKPGKGIGDFPLPADRDRGDPVRAEIRPGERADSAELWKGGVPAAEVLLRPARDAGGA